jgi:transposase, IS5 family
MRRRSEHLHRNGIKISDGTIVDATIIGAPSSKTKLIHTILASAANVSDVDALRHLLHGRETRFWGDQGYQGQTEVIRARAPRAKDFTNRKYRGRGWLNEVEKAKNTKSQVRAKVEHTIGVIERVFGFQTVRYRGLAKPLHRLEVTAAPANLYTVRRRLLRAQERCRCSVGNGAVRHDNRRIGHQNTAALRSRHQMLPMTAFTASSSECP